LPFCAGHRGLGEIFPDAPITTGGVADIREAGVSRRVALEMLPQFWSVIMQLQKAECAEGGTTATRLDHIGWGIFLVMIGTIWLVPSVPPGTWLIGTGILLLALNAIRSRLGVPWSGFWVGVGAVAFVAGLADFADIRLPIFPICLVILGAALILKTLVSQHA
jgi:hypothetical protein